MTRALAILACCVGLTVGCTRPQEAPTAAEQAAVTPAEPEAPTLNDTNWRLVEIQSMDDAVGTKYPDDRNNYTMRLNADGTVSMKLNCNNASGSWKSEPSADPTNGTFEFGPLAMTRALCPPPSLDEAIASQAQWVRGFMLKDGRLSLSLMADGGIQIWEPADIEVPFETTPDAEIEKAVLDSVPEYTQEIVDIGTTGPARYVYTKVDVNGDGNAEVFVYLMESIFCGTGGCNMMLFTPGGSGGYTLVNNFPISRPPVILSPVKSNGWSDLFRLESGGGVAPSYVRHVFDGKAYVEKERMEVGTVPPEGKWLLAGELGPEVGATLSPRE